MTLGFSARTTCALLAVPLAALISTLGGCYMEVHDQKDKAAATDPFDPRSPGAMQIKDADKCDDGLEKRMPGSGAQQCFNNADFAWRTSCKKASCQAVKVFTHYMLDKDLGSEHPVHVEAFDNPGFQGAPAASVRLSHFNAKPGQWQDADVYLEPGEYYMRAYMSNEDDETSKPYQFGGMTLVQGQPVGVYGALSGAEKVSVAPRLQNPYPAPVHIYLDRAFKSGDEPDTNAHIRLSMTLAAGQSAPDGREVKIALHRSADLNEAPEKEFVMASSLFLVQSRLGKADYLTPSLEEGDYVIFVYLDANGNKLYDQGELQAVYKENGQPFAVHVVKGRTAPVAIELSVEGSQTAPRPPQPSVPPPATQPAQPGQPTASTGAQPTSPNQP